MTGPFKISIVGDKVQFYISNDSAATSPNVLNTQYKQFFRGAELTQQEGSPDMVKLCFASSVVCFYPAQIEQVTIGETTVEKSVEASYFVSEALLAALLSELEPTTTL